MNIYDKLKNFINDYSNIEQEYHSKTHDILNRDPFVSLSYHELTVCAYKVSIIIPSWNCGETLIHTLKTIKNMKVCKHYNQQLEVIIIDDGSSDGTHVMLQKERFPFMIKYVRQKHSGRACAVNTAASVATGDMFIFCDADILLLPGTLDELIMRQQRFMDEAIFFGFRSDKKIQDFSGIEERLYHEVPAFWEDNRFLYDDPRSWGTNMMRETNLLRHRDATKNIWVSDGIHCADDCWQFYRMVYGFLFSVSKRVFYRVGGFNEKMVTWGWEDSEFTVKCNSIGVKIVPVPSAVCIHISHNERTENQWEKSKKNFDILQNRLYDDSPFQPTEHSVLENRIECYEEMQANYTVYELDILETRKKVCQSYLCDESKRGRYHSKLANFHKAMECYDKLSVLHEIDDISNYFDAAIRMHKKERMLKALQQYPIHNIYIARVAAFLFDVRIDKLVDEPDKHFTYCLLHKPDEHMQRAMLYWDQQQYFLALLDFFAAMYLGSEEGEQYCKACKNKIFEGYFNDCE